MRDKECRSGMRPRGGARPHGLPPTLPRRMACARARHPARRAPPVHLRAVLGEAGAGHARARGGMPSEGRNAQAGDHAQPLGGVLGGSLGGLLGGSHAAELAPSLHRASTELAPRTFAANLHRACTELGQPPAHGARILLYPVISAPMDGGEPCKGL